MGAVNWSRSWMDVEIVWIFQWEHWSLWRKVVRVTSKLQSMLLPSSFESTFLAPIKHKINHWEFDNWFYRHSATVAYVLLGRSLIGLLGGSCHALRMHVCGFQITEEILELVSCSPHFLHWNSYIITAFCVYGYEKGQNSNSSELNCLFRDKVAQDTSRR